MNSTEKSATNKTAKHAQHSAHAPLRAAIIWSGASFEMTAMPHVPSRRVKAFLTASSIDIFSSRYLPISCTITSVSVCERNLMPVASSSARNSELFSIVPLCTSATRSLASRCGCAFSSVLPPCVAQRWQRASVRKNASEKICR